MKNNWFLLLLFVFCFISCKNYNASKEASTTKKSVENMENSYSNENINPTVPYIGDLYIDKNIDSVIIYDKLEKKISDLNQTDINSMNFNEDYFKLFPPREASAEHLLNLHCVHWRENCRA